eukprot:TRINITY_DN89601_c0_g1_i1.p2 TRINITY_DN89601_c0_g1~~TRINITY_DN89601_c0_g1_i1.p2  ORF type:complete len:146 (-),score=12.41 TRINITY_DN89601_c0_g1_i1:84-521(-)
MFLFFQNRFMFDAFFGFASVFPAKPGHILGELSCCFDELNGNRFPWLVDATTQQAYFSGLEICVFIIHMWRIGRIIRILLPRIMSTIHCKAWNASSKLHDRFRNWEISRSKAEYATAAGGNRSTLRSRRLSLIPLLRSNMRMLHS